MRVFVTGSSGLIGKWAAERLIAEGHEFAGYDKRPSPYEHLAESCVVGDILDEAALRDALERFAPEAVIHLAARCDLDGKTLTDYDDNVAGVRNVCNAVRATSSVRRAVYTSSQLVCRVGHIPANDREYCPDTVYGRSKVRTEEIVREEDGGGVTWCIARPTTVWGPYMGDHYKSLLRYIRQGRYFHSGSGRLLKSYGYAENVAYQYCRLIEAPTADVGGKVFYVADYAPLSLREYVDRLADALGVRRPPTLPLPLARALAATGDVLNALGVRFPYNRFRLRNIRTEYVFDLEPTRRVCGELPRSFSQGIEATARWFLDSEPGK
jgi:nucleoside-diphosphate-sugar epimerase